MDDQGTAAGQEWQIWSNQGGGCITTFSIPAFTASWNNSGDFLARTGLVWQNPQPYATYGTITAQFAESKTGTGGNFSFIGIYGWSLPTSSTDTSHCVEWYIVDDSFNPMPVGGGGSNPVAMGTGTIDGSEYTFYKSSTNGTGGNNCGASFTTWTQYYSVRQTARQCGQITITDHFTAWAGKGMTLGNLQEAQVLVETGGGSGNIVFTTASVTATQ
jgi:endo-1,4-beta-xylanase